MMKHLPPKDIEVNIMLKLKDVVLFAFQMHAQNIFLSYQVHYEANKTMHLTVERKDFYLSKANAL